MGGAIIGGAALAGAADVFGGFSANSSARSAAKVQRHWEERMSNTAIQRRAADLKAAGLNPLLATGQAASVPEVAPAQTFRSGQETAHAFSSAGQALAQLGLQKQQVASQVALNASLSTKAASEANQAEAQADYQRAITPGAASAQSADIQEKLSRAGLQDVMRQVQSETVKKAIAETANISQLTRQSIALVDKVGVEMEQIRADTGLKEMETSAAAFRARLDQATATEKLGLLPLIQEMHRINNELMNSGLPGARNKAAAQESWLVKATAEIGAAGANLLPGLNSAGAAAGAAGRIVP